MSNTTKLLFVLGIVILGIMGWSYAHHTSSPVLLGATANQCASGQTCLPSLELTGPNGGVTNGLQIDSGISEFNGAISALSTFTLGSSGTALSKIIDVTGSIIGNASVTASTTKAFDIAVTGIVTGDRCLAQAASTTQTSLGFSVVGCSASTTAGFATLLVANATGAAAVVPYPIASSTHVFVTR